MSPRDQSPRAPEPIPAPPSSDAGLLIDIVNAKGLHARAAARFAALAGSFDATVTLSRDDLSANGGSIMGLMMLAAARGTQVRLQVEGPEAEAARTALADFIREGFGEGREGG